MEKPIAKKSPRELVTHGEIRVDDYYWLNERENPEVIEYLEQENLYQETMMKDTEELQNKIYDEIDIGDYLNDGKNEIFILVWHTGENFSRSIAYPAGVIFEILSPIKCIIL